MNTELIELQITNETGHTTLQMEPVQMPQVIREHPRHWVFVDDQLIGRERVATFDWEGVLNVRLMPALVGGIGAIEWR